MAKKVNTHRKEARARRWAAGRTNKELRKAAQAEREKINKQLRADGKPTLHEQREIIRKAKRVDKDMQPRNDVGNILIDVVVIDEHGPVVIKGVKPCCQGKSYRTCNHNPKAISSKAVMSKGKFIRTEAGI